MKHALAPTILLILAACSGNSSNDAQADRLDNAAEQSTPEAANVLHNQADAIREQGATGAPGAPNSTVQQAMNSAAAAQSQDRQAPVPGVSPSKRPHPNPVGTPPAGSR